MMVTLQCTQNLLKALNVKPVERTKSPTAKLGDWYAKPVQTVAGDLIVCMSAPTYLSVAIPMNQLPLFPVHFHTRVYNLLRHLGIPAEIAAAEVQHYKELRYARTQSRQLLGILNQLAWHYQVYAELGVGAETQMLSEAEIRNATAVYGAPDYKTPLEEVRKALGVDAG
jgi:hypothetical protein